MLEGEDTMPIISVVELSQQLRCLLYPIEACLLRCELIFSFVVMLRAKPDMAESIVADPLTMSSFKWSFSYV